MTTMAKAITTIGKAMTTIGKAMKTGKAILFLMSVMLLCSCGKDEEHGFRLEGAWTLVQQKYPNGKLYEFPNEGHTAFRIYEGDSVVYNCQLLYTGSGIVVVPLGTKYIKFVELGGGEYIYMEEEDLCPLVVLSDSSMTTQHNGVVNTWVRAERMSEQKIAEIRNIISNDQLNDADEWVRHYVLSTTERKLLSDKHRLEYIVAGLVLVLMVVVRIAVAKHQREKRTASKLKEMEKESILRPLAVKQAMETVEHDFFESDYYVQLCHNISQGIRLGNDDWTEIERRLNEVYPNFSTHLQNLYKMSDIEHQVSILIKMRIPPTSIATVLMRDVSTISTIRMRLYQKVFSKKGSAKDWDDFLNSIGR